MISTNKINLGKASIEPDFIPEQKPMQKPFKTSASNMAEINNTSPAV
jgi:hypothetical protein